MLYIDMRSFRAGRKTVKSKSFHDLWCLYFNKLRSTPCWAHGRVPKYADESVDMDWLCEICFCGLPLWESQRFLQPKFENLEIDPGYVKGNKANDGDSTMLFWEGGSIDMAGPMSANHHLTWCILSFCFHPAMFMCFSQLVFPVDI